MSKAQWLVSSWFVCGVVSSLAGFTGLWYLPVALVLILPLAALIKSSWTGFQPFRTWNRTDQSLATGLGLVWLFHLVGVLVPETGFDAVWYHLPVVSQFVAAHQFIYLPELYQSLNPFFADGIYLLGFLIGGEFGAKMVAYGITLSLVIVSYQVARLFLTRTTALLATILISTFQVVTWQASSFYIDTAKALFEMGGLLWLLTAARNWKSYFVSGLLFGAVLGSKAFNLVMLPWILLVAVVSRPQPRWQKIAVFMTAAFLVAIPYYWRTYYYSGNALLALTLPAQNLQEIGGQPTVFAFLIQQLLTFPSSLIQLSLFSTDYVSFALLLLLPFGVWFVSQNWRDHRVQMLLIWSLGQYLLWWFVPPLSTRYALSGFITLLILEMVAVEAWNRTHSSYQKPLQLMLIIAIGFNLLPRLVVTSRHLKYIVGSQTKHQYLEQFYDGSIDQHLKKWHQLP